MGRNNFFNVLVPQSHFFTPEGGRAIKMINKTGAPSVKGYLVNPYSASAIDNAFAYIPIDNPDPIGVVWNAGVPDGEETIIVTGGKAYVYYIAAVQRGLFARNRAGAEGGASGQAVGEALPTPPFATDKHFQEHGHILETIGGAGLALTDIHFN